MKAYFYSSAPYITDNLFLNLHPREYDADGAPVRLNAPDAPRQSRCYKDEYFRFGRDLFYEYVPDEGGSEGHSACFQLQDWLEGFPRR